MADRSARQTPPPAAPAASMRLDKWLWAARMYKTRSLAADELDKGRIHINGQSAKPSRDVRVGDRLEIRRSGHVQTLDVRGLSAMRGPAPVAQLLYAETPESLAAAQALQQARREGTEPALSQPQGRPTKRDRRQLGDWQRWSASLDDD
jgi:ribosome-associated heat shock protein Hsp15